MKESGQDWKEGFADWFRNVKGIGIQRDWNPLGLLYDEDEADYYKNLYKKTRLEEKKSAQLEENKILADVAGVTSDKIKTGAGRRVGVYVGRYVGKMIKPTILSLTITNAEHLTN